MGSFCSKSRQKLEQKTPERSSAISVDLPDLEEEENPWTPTFYEVCAVCLKIFQASEVMRCPLCQDIVCDDCVVSHDNTYCLVRDVLGFQHQEEYKGKSQ